MPRPAKFSNDDILDGAARAVASFGRDSTVAQAAMFAGAPVGSVYHRFPSRDELFVSLWLRAISRFHAGLLDVDRYDDAHQALLAAAAHVPRYCRSHPLDARAMTLYRQRQLVETGPVELRTEVTRVNDDVLQMMRSLTERRYGSITQRRLELVAMACQEGPYGLVRRYLTSGELIPAWLDDVVRASADAVLKLGD